MIIAPHPDIPLFDENNRVLPEEAREALAEIARREREEPIRYFKANPGSQEEFFELLKKKREVAFFAGNKSGKCVAADTLISGERIDSFGFEKGIARLWDLGGKLRVAAGHRVLTPTGWHAICPRKGDQCVDRFVALLQAPALTSGEICLSDFLSGDSRWWQTVSSFQSDYQAYFRSHGGRPQTLSEASLDGSPLPVGALASFYSFRYTQEHIRPCRDIRPLSSEDVLHPVRQSFSVPDLDVLPRAEQSLPNILAFDLSALPANLSARVLSGSQDLDLASSLVYVVMWPERNIYSILLPVNITPTEGVAEESYWDTNIPFIHAYEAGGFINHNTHCGAKFVVQASLGKRAGVYGMEVLYDEPIDVWVGSVDYRIQRESAQREVEHFLPKAEIEKMYTLQNGIIDRIELKNGSTIGFKTYEQGRKAWQGPKRHIVWFDEEPPEEIIKEGMARLIGKNAKLIFTMTPLMGHTIVYTRFIEDVGVPYRGYVFGTTYENKEHLDAEYLKTMEDMSEDDRAQRLLGQFMRLEGLVFNEFNPKEHVIPHIEPENDKYTFIGGIDFGADHPTAFVHMGVDAYENIYIYREYKQREATLEDHAKAWRIAKGGHEISRIFGDPSAKQWIKEFRSFRDTTLRMAISPGINDRPSGISLINSLFKKKKLFISENCPQLIYELTHHRYKTRKEGQKDGDVVKTEDDLCLAKGTMIATPLGEKPIENISVGDKVLTPYGISRVLAATKTGRKKVLDRIGLKGTPNHPVFSLNRGFARLDAIGYKDILVPIDHFKILLWRLRKKLFLMGKPTPTLVRTSIFSLLRKTEKVARFSTATFGRNITVKSRTDMLFIILTIIPAIIISPILSACLLLRTCGIIGKKMQRILSLCAGLEKISIWLENLQVNGTGAKGGWSGIKNTLLKWLRKKVVSLKSKKRAKCVQKYTYAHHPKLTSQDSVAISVKQGLGEMPDWTTSRLGVPIVETTLSKTSIVTPCTAQEDAGKEDVYNLSTEHGVYFADGVLVSNCDALRYALSAAVRAKLHSGFQVSWNLNPSRLAGVVAQW